MKRFLSFLSEGREYIVKSWYHPATDREVLVDTLHADSLQDTIDSHTNHLFNNHELYGFKSPHHILTRGGHSETEAKEMVKHMRKHHKEHGDYIDWHDATVHAMHNQGWVRIVKSNDYTDTPKIYAGSNNKHLSKQAADQLSAKDPTTKIADIHWYNKQDVHPTHDDQFYADNRGRSTTYNVNTESRK